MQNLPLGLSQILSHTDQFEGVLEFQLQENMKILYNLHDVLPFSFYLLGIYPLCSKLVSQSLSHSVFGQLVHPSFMSSLQSKHHYK